MNRRQFFAATGVSLFPARRHAFGQALQVHLPGNAIPQFADPLPLLSVAGGPVETVIADTGEITLRMQEFAANVMPSTFRPATGKYAGTFVWGYRAGVQPTTPAAGSYIGPVIVATRGIPTQIRFVNELGDAGSTKVLAWKSATDQTLHWADPLHQEANACNMQAQSGQAPTGYCASHYYGPIPAVIHIHGGEVPPALDGGPDAWFTSDGAWHGHAYYTKAGAAPNEAVYRYPNTQEAAPIWFHDHTLGVTRLSVYAGLAGAYPLIDPDLRLPAGLHPVGLQQGAGGPVEYAIPVVIQDRAFDSNGQLFLLDKGVNPEHPFWKPEFSGDTIVVTGKVWPFLEVAPKRYRFYFINGSNARAYELFLADSRTQSLGPPIWQIASDGGYLDAPVKIDPNAKSLNKLVLMPGERADCIIDFAGLRGRTLILRNTGRMPYPDGALPDAATTGRVLQIRVNQALRGPDASYDPASGIPLRPKMVRLVQPATGALGSGVTAHKVRLLTLNEIHGPGGPLELLLNNTKWNGVRLDGTVRPDFVAIKSGKVTVYHSELPNEGETEVWEIVNLTVDAHPIHTHLTQFQLLNRQAFDLKRYNLAYEESFPGGRFLHGYGPPLNYQTGNPRALGGNPDISAFLQGPVKPPGMNEAGWKDTVAAYPSQVTRIVVRFAPTDRAVDDPDLHYPFDPDAVGHGYAWHCHIIGHEDNEMMRPFSVRPKEAAKRRYVQGRDY